MGKAYTQVTMTRPLASMVTPCHSLIGRSLSQFVLAVHFSPSMEP